MGGQTTNGKEQGKNKAEEGNENGEHDGVSYIQKVFSTDADAAAPAPAVIAPGEADTAAPDIAPAPAPEEDGEEADAAAPAPAVIAPGEADAAEPAPDVIASGEEEADTA